MNRTKIKKEKQGKRRDSFSFVCLNISEVIVLLTLPGNFLCLLSVYNSFHLYSINIIVQKFGPSVDLETR